MSQQLSRAIATGPERVAPEGFDSWNNFWKTRGMPWRTQPEIDEPRQQFLDERRDCSDDLQSVYPFSGIKLDRGDVEWLLATHNAGGIVGPLSWEEEHAKPTHLRREGLDVRGADLRKADLSHLPLAFLRASMPSSQWITASRSDSELRTSAPARFEEANLRGAQLQGALLTATRMEDAVLAYANLEGADLYETHLDRANLSAAHLEGAYLRSAYLLGTTMFEAHFERSMLFQAHFEGANLKQANLSDANATAAYFEGADLREAYLKKTILKAAQLEFADLSAARLDGSNLHEAQLNGAILVGAHLEDANLGKARLDGKAYSRNDSEYTRIKKWAMPFPATLEPADLRGAFFSTGTNLQDAAFGSNTLGNAFVADARWGGANLSVVVWAYGEPGSKRSNRAVVILGDERRANLPRHSSDRPKDPIVRLQEHAAAVRANRQLAVALRGQGLNEDADHFAYRGQVLHRQVLSRQQRYLSAFGSWLLDLISGYGYKPMRAFITYALVILVFAGLYLLNAQFAAPHLTWDEALVLSISSFHGRGFFPSDIHLGDNLARLAAGEAIIGLLIEITFIATFTQRFFAR